jgi:hypothetical protein
VDIVRPEKAAAVPKQCTGVALCAAIRTTADSARFHDVVIVDDDVDDDIVSSVFDLQDGMRMQNEKEQKIGNG